MDFEFALDEDLNTNEVNTHVIDPMLNNENDVDRYIRLINILGLNTNITYPIRMIANSICESYMVSDNLGKSTSNYYRGYQFKKDEYSTKIRNILDFRDCVTKISLIALTTKIRRIYSYYRYNLISNQRDSASNSMDIVGFNHKYSGWNTS
jgi:hypothetical protein